MRVQVYFDSTRRIYSIRGKDKRTGRTRVLFKMRRLSLKNADFAVNHKGVDRIRKTRRKEIVATVNGDLLIGTDPDYVQGAVVRFNPYHMMEFQLANGTPIHHADMVHFTERGVFAS
jgi:hypothetical protein